MIEDQDSKPTLYKFTNYAESPELDDILAMFYTGIATNTVGIMQAMNMEKGEQELVLVGISLDEDGKPDCFPLAVCLRAEDVGNYLAPDGKGGFYDLSDAGDVARVKEDMKSAEEATVD